MSRQHEHSGNWRSGMRSSDYGNYQQRNDWRKNMISPAPRESADYYAENVGNSDHYGKGPKGWKKSDEALREEVCETLLRAPLDASDVDVSVEGATVYLRGTVSSRENKRAVEEEIEGISGVDDVMNLLKVSRS